MEICPHWFEYDIESVWAIADVSTAIHNFGIYAEQWFSACRTSNCRMRKRRQALFSFSSSLHFSARCPYFSDLISVSLFSLRRLSSLLYPNMVSVITITIVRARIGNGVFSHCFSIASMRILSLCIASRALCLSLSSVALIVWIWTNGIRLWWWILPLFC